MKKVLGKLGSIAIALTMVVSLASCGAQFNNVGITTGNLENGGEVTAQDGTTYYLHDGDIYKTKDVNKEGELILEGDISNLNIVGEKLYFYDNAISTICKSNTAGEKIERIAELYCEKFVVGKDNIYAQILTGQGEDSLEDPDNYNIVRLKITDRKLANTMPKAVIEKGKLVGCIGDKIYVEKNTKDGIALFRTDLDGGSEKKLMKLSKDSKVIGDADGFVVLGTVDKQYGLYSYTAEGKFEKKLSNLIKNHSKGGNVVNMDSEYVYYEDYATKKKGNKKVVADNLLKIKRDGTGKEHIMKNNKNMNYQISVGNNGVMIKAKDAKNLDHNPIWKGL